MKGKVINCISRRNLFKLSAVTVGTGLITSCLGIDLSDSPAAIAKQNITSNQALDELLHRRWFL
jgi:hypothetical protein